MGKHGVLTGFECGRVVALWCCGVGFECGRVLGLWCCGVGLSVVVCLVWCLLGLGLSMVMWLFFLGGLGFIFKGEGLVLNFMAILVEQTVSH